MRVNFYINRRMQDKEKRIYIYFTMKGKRQTVALPYRVLPENWNVEKQRLKERAIHSYKINAILDDLEFQIKDFWNSLALKKETVTHSFLKKWVVNLVSNIGIVKKEPKTIDFFEAFTLFLEYKRKTIQEVSLSPYVTLQGHLYNFNQTNKINFNRIDIKFYDSLVAFLFDAKLNNNSVGKMIKSLKTFLDYCFERQIIKDQRYKSFKSISNKVEINPLTSEELTKLENVIVDKDLEKAKDIFLFGCYVGQRFSDYSNVKKSQIDYKNNIWSVIQEKTNKKVDIPLISRAKTILAKYKDLDKDLALPSITIQKLNKDIKEVCKQAGIDKMIEVISYFGNTEKKELLPKYETITSHDARRTFITLSLERGMRPETVMEISGHTDYNSFQKYIKITKKSKIEEMKSVWEVEKTKEQELKDLQVLIKKLGLTKEQILKIF